MSTNRHDAEFQSRTGSTGHLAITLARTMLQERGVSIPNGLHRPFSREGWLSVIDRVKAFQSRTGSTGHLATEEKHMSAHDGVVSIPNGLHRPFSLQFLRRLYAGKRCFNPERAPQAI